MPEGHTIHRLALAHRELFAGQTVTAASPQGRFADGAAELTGRTLESTEANGKHLIHRYSGGPILHVHLGLYGSFITGAGEPPVPRGALRLRLSTPLAWSDLRGPTACELINPAQLEMLYDRLGADPLRRNADPLQAFVRLSRSRTSIAALLMDQSVVAGIGNVYRAELLFRHGMDPFAPGRSISETEWMSMWADLVTLMRAGVRSGRIVTVRREDAPRKRGPLSREEAHYVYRRAGLACRVCGTEVRTATLVGRNLFWCPTCQPPR